MYIGLQVKLQWFCSILIKLEFSGQFFEKSPNIKFHENPSSGSRVVPYGQTEVALRNFANAPKNAWWRFYCFYCTITALKRSASFPDLCNHTQPSKYKVSGTKDAAT